MSAAHQEIMNYQTSSPILLIVNSSQVELTPSCSILASLDCTYISILETSPILSWIQQNQPDLIILDLSWSQLIEMQLISTLRLDWLTRNIPILVLNKDILTSSQSIPTLDYDAYLAKPYSCSALEKAIYYLVPSLPKKKYDEVV